VDKSARHQALGARLRAIEVGGPGTKAEVFAPSSEPWVVEVGAWVGVEKQRAVEPGVVRPSLDPDAFCEMPPRGSGCHQPRGRR